MTHGTQKPFNSNIFRNFASANYQNQKNMDLKTFVKETLTQIAEGVNEAKQSLKANGMQVASTANRMSTDMMYTVDANQQRHYVSIVNFEAILDIETSQDKSGDIGVKASFLSYGKKKGSQETSNDVTKVSFSVPISFD